MTTDTNSRKVKMGEEVRPEVIQQTQKCLGKYVKKPQLTEKLLKKPPFRFLHDVIRVVVQETGFLRGLFTAEEMVSENVKERDKKIAFLNKLIDATKAISGTELSVKSSKIIAGLEPTQTNLLLQTIGKAIDKKLDSSQYIQQLKKSKVKPDSEDKPKKASESTSKTRLKTKEETTKEKRSEKVKKESSNKNLISPNTKDTKKKDDRKRSEKTKKGEVTPKSDKVPKNIKTEEGVVKTNKTLKKEEINELPEKGDEIPEETDKDDKAQSKDVEVKDDEVRENQSITETETIKNKSDEPETVTEIKSPLIRPKSAKPKSANLKQNEIKVTEEKELTSSSTLRPPSVRPSSARPGAPRLRPDSALPLKEPVTMGKINVIVENFDKTDDQEDDEETVVIENAPEEIEETKSHVDLNIPQEKGQLVEEILKQIGDDDVVEKKISSTEWQIDAFKNKNVAKEMEQLRNSIQTLTRVANPFGKLISYLHEDVETMYNELNMWKNMKRQTFVEIKKQEKITEELCKPLHEQLKNLDSAIKKQQDDILVMRAKVLKNDARIKQTISQFV